MIAGVLTASELALLRTRPQRTQLYLAIPDYHTVYTADELGAPASNDNVVSINFDGGVGTLADVLPGMMLLVGSTAGDWDIGIARIRKAPIAGTFYIGITSEIEWANDLHLTVIDDFGLWPKHPYIDAATSVSYMDYDIAYTNQNEYGDPVPILGPHAVVETGGHVNFDATDSYSCIGVISSANDYAWYVDGVLASNAGSVDITFTSPGTYLIKLTVTAHYAADTITKTSTAYRYVIVYDHDEPLNASFVLESCEGDFSSGGWSYRVTMNAKATEVYVRDRTLCMLVARDWYGDTEQSIGPLTDRENIICIGWVDGESLRRSNDKSLVSFDIQGPAFWLGVQEGFPTGVDDTDAAPTDWLHIEELDPRKGLFSFLHWRTTATAVIDCWITADDHRLATTYTPSGSLLEQLRAISERVNAKTVCDRYGRLFCEIDTQFIDPALRAFPTVQTLVDRDWRDEITFERRILPAASQVDLSGVHWGGTILTSSAIFSLSPGHYPKHYGAKQKIERIALDDQAEANTLAGLWLGYYNNEYPNIDVPLSANHRGIDIAPRMFVKMNLAAGDTPRGIAWSSAKNLIPRRVSYDYDGREAVLLTDVTFEAESFPSDAIVGDPPIEPPAEEYTPPPPPTPPDMPLPEEYDVVVAITTNHIGRALNFYTADPATDVVWEDISTGLPVGCTMYNLQVGGAEGWLIVVDAGSYDLYYCSDLTALAPAWSLVLTSADTTTYPNVLVTNLNKAMAVTAAGVCYVACYQDGTLPNNVPYFRCVAGAVAGFEFVAQASGGAATCINESPAAAACDDGTDVYLATGNSVFPNACMWISPTLGTWAASVTGERTAYAVSSGHYNVGGLNNSQYTLAGALTRVGAFNFGKVAEKGGHTFWIRTADKFLMIDAAIQAVPNDTDGGTGVFSVGPGATGTDNGYDFGAGGYGEILWVASTAAVTNSKRSIAFTSDGGVTWETRDGNWAAVFGAWEGGTNAMIRTGHI